MTNPVRQRRNFMYLFIVAGQLPDPFDTVDELCRECPSIRDRPLYVTQIKRWATKAETGDTLSFSVNGGSSVFNIVAVDQKHRTTEYRMDRLKEVQKTVVETEWANAPTEPTEGNSGNAE